MVVAPWADPGEDAAGGLDIVVEDVGALFHNLPQRGPGTGEVWDEDFDPALGVFQTDLFDASGEDGGADLPVSINLESVSLHPVWLRAGYALSAPIIPIGMGPAHRFSSDYAVVTSNGPLVPPPSGGEVTPTLCVQRVQKLCNVTKLGLVCAKAL